MKCAVMRAHMLKLRFIGKSKISFPTSPVPLRSVMGPSTFWCIVELYRPRGTSAYSRMHAITRADSRKTRGIISPGVKIALFFARAYSLSSCVEKSIERWKTCGNAPSETTNLLEVQQPDGFIAGGNPFFKWRFLWLR